MEKGARLFRDGMAPRALVTGEPGDKPDQGTLAGL